MPAPLWVFLSYEVESNSCFLIKKTPWVLEIIFVGKKEDFILLRQPFKFQNTVFRHFFIQFLSSDTVLRPQHWRGVTGTQGAGLVLASGHRELVQPLVGAKKHTQSRRDMRRNERRV